MTKRDELALLDRTIDTFGPHSYIGPWLSDYRAELERTITSDLPIGVPSPMRAQAEALAILAAAKTEATDIRNRATENANAELERTRAECQQYRDALRDRVRSALGAFLDRF